MEEKTKVFEINVTRKVIRKATLLVKADSAEAAKEIAEAHADQHLGDDEMVTIDMSDRVSKPVLATNFFVSEVEKVIGCGISEVTVVPT